MTDADPPLEAQRFGRDQTPESPRPVHLPEPSTIPVLLNQMDPVFNDTETYNIPHNQTFSPYSDSARAMNENDPDDPNTDEQDAVQNFLRGAEEENARLDDPAQFPSTNTHIAQNEPSIEGSLFSALANASAYPQSSDTHANPPQTQLDANPAEDASHTSDLSKPAIEPTGNLDADNTTQATHATSLSDSGPAVNLESRSNQGGVDYQSLLATISQSASTAPVADPVSAPTTASSFAQLGAQSVLSVPGLPPKPPAQAQSSDASNVFTFPNVTADQHGLFQQFKQQDHFHSMKQEENTNTANQEGHYQPVTHDAYSHANGVGASAPYPAHFPPQPIPLQAPGTGAWTQPGSQVSPISPTHSLQPPEPIRSSDPAERPWSPHTQTLYDSFLEDERRYVTEGIWDKFPMGSRLFVGNLPSEKVTKRDIFHIFHRHGRLAQISIKQAYGFVQYLEASSCHAALQAEQGVEIRGRKIHLEVSKPQKNTRNQQGQQGNKRRRSRSPDRANPRQIDRFDRPDASYSEFREERGRRNDFRRSPSPPRGYRSRDDHRPPLESPRFGPGGRPNSPFTTAFPYPPPPGGYDEESTLPLPRRDPRDIPDVQLLILEPSVAQSFINWIEQGFRNKGLRASTIWLSARLPLPAVVKRQIIEGVQAVVKLVQANQYNSRIPLQVFDRSQGTTNVSFNEYVDLDIAVAADIVLSARQKERTGLQQSPQSYHPPQGYPPPQNHYGYPPPPQPQYPPAGYPPQHQPHNQYQYNQNAHYQSQAHTPVTPSSATSSANLQQLLANLRQPGDSQPNSASPNGKTPDLAGLLSNVARHQQGPPHQQQSPTQHGYGPVAPAYGAGQQQSQQNVQNIMDTLARYNR
ncbi:nuclear polyadenylated RNA-binding protein 3 [Cladophialophora chaetospira]|uniref:Nuclear polyadenylated RNA-binding protein 3 n=1 Tax=Cladophialophora chaetospira TaxID=386627 RepID=A0AA38WZQ4_9EURO|nr:nuclear polyadenylated RNA-binding protein 3 [Cladophialophora chaetospira]